MLDSGPLSLVTQKPGRSRAGDDARAWFANLSRAGIPVYVPEIADYELRRELLRSRLNASIARLDAFNGAWAPRYLPLTTPVIRLAASLWAQARNTGVPTASREALDADVIVAAQALVLPVPGLVVATTNAAHLRRFVNADDWRRITA